jgi:hypothetical protein
MRFDEVLAELPAFSLSERQQLIREALELDEPGLSSKDEEIVESRLIEHRRNPQSALSLDEIKSRLRTHFPK